MAALFNMSEAAAIGIHCCILLAEKESGLTSREIASTLDVSLDHCVRVLHNLRKGGLINGTRGPSGGFKLAVKADELTVLAVYETLEGKLCDKRCLFKNAKCKDGCPLFGSLVGKINMMTRRFFEETNIGKLAKEHKKATQ